MYRPLNNQLCSGHGDLWKPPGLILHWPLNDGPASIGAAEFPRHGLSRSDIGVSEDYGKMTNSPGAAWRYDRQVGGYCLDYSSRMNIAYLSTNGMTGFNPGLNFSMSLWVRVNSLVVDGSKINQFFGKQVWTGVADVKAGMFGMDPTQSNKVSFETTYTSGGSQHNETLYSSAPLVFNRWVHIVGTYAAGAGTKLYLNGILDNTGTTTSPYVDQYIGEWQVGANSVGGTHIHPDAQMWQAMVFNRVLAASEVKKLYLSRNYA